MARLLWYMQDFIRHSTLFPSLTKIIPQKSRVFILGNGPSLNGDIAAYKANLANEELMMVNQAITHKLAFELKPKYYVLMDPAYWGFYTQSEDVQGLLKASIHNLSKSLNRVTWDMYILAPNHFYHNRTQKGIHLTNPRLHIALFNASELYTFPLLQKWLYTRNLAIPSGINVLLAALCCAVTLKYKEIYLLGADSSWHSELFVDSDNKVYCLDTHYYHKNAEKIYTPYPLSFHLQCCAEAFKAYSVLGKVFPHIVNCTSISMIDGLNRGNLAHIFTRGGARARFCINLLRFIYLSQFLSTFIYFHSLSFSYYLRAQKSHI